MALQPAHLPDRDQQLMTRRSWFRPALRVRISSARQPHIGDAPLRSAGGQ